MRFFAFCLILVTTPSCALYTINDIPFDPSEINSSCSVVAQEFFSSIQASTFYHQYDFDEYIGEKPHQRLLRSYSCDNKGTSIYYYEYDEPAKAIDALNIITPFIWDYHNLPSQDHPEAIVLIKNIIVVISGDNISTVENGLLNDSKISTAVSIGKQLLTGEQYLHARNYQQAIAALMPVARTNHAIAQGYLCDVFIILEKSKEAINWCTRAADNGNSNAQLRLANMNMSGKWLRPDLNTAIAWLEKASAQGNSNADALLSYYHQFKAVDVNDDLIEKLSNHLKCSRKDDKNIVFACHSLELFRKGNTVDIKQVDGSRLVGVGVAFNASGNPVKSSLELAGLEFHLNDPVSDKIFRFRATPTEPGEAEIINSAILALLSGTVPLGNFAYQFVSTSPLSLEPSLSWKNSSGKSTGSVIDGFRILFRQHKDTVVALELHPEDKQVLANRFYIMQYKIK